MATELCMAQHQQHPHISRPLLVLLECLVQHRTVFSICIELSNLTISFLLELNFHHHHHRPIIIVSLSYFSPLSSAERVNSLGQGAPLPLLNKLLGTKGTPLNLIMNCYVSCVDCK
jgi:hypothetical protein